jgi:hypothetical protein
MRLLDPPSNLYSYSLSFRFETRSLLPSDPDPPYYSPLLLFTLHPVRPPSSLTSPHLGLKGPYQPPLLSTSTNPIRIFVILAVHRRPTEKNTRTGGLGQGGGSTILQCKSFKSLWEKVPGATFFTFTPFRRGVSFGLGCGFFFALALVWFGSLFGGLWVASHYTLDTILHVSPSSTRNATPTSTSTTYRPSNQPTTGNNIHGEDVLTNRATPKILPYVTYRPSSPGSLERTSVDI